MRRNRDKQAKIALLACLLTIFAALCLESCSQMAPYGIGYSGRVQDEIYYSPDGTFQVRIPFLLKPGAKIQDHRVSDNAFIVSMSDDLCRMFIVAHIAYGTSDRTLDSWVDNYIIDKKKPNIVERKTIDTPFGQGIYIRSRIPEGAPCALLSFVDGKRKEGKPDADNAMVFVRINTRVYQFIYTRSVEDVFAIYETGPVDTLLIRFMGGFKPLR